MVALQHICKVVTLVFGLMWLLPMPIAAQNARVKRVQTEYQFIAGHDMNIQQAKQVALQRAQLQAIADEFGTIISNATATQVANTQSGDNAGSSVKVVSLGMSDVRGEWIETIGEPDYNVTIDNDLGVIVRVKVEGKIRERVAAEIDLKAITLRNGTTIKSRDESFYAGDYLYLLFQAPSNGYLAIYLTDSENAYCLLPYQSQYESAMKIERNKEYVLFSKEQAPQTMKEIVDEYYMTCGKTMEMNRLYIIFSPNEFSKALDEAGDGILPRHLTMHDFQKWLGKVRAHDVKLTCKAIDIDINPTK